MQDLAVASKERHDRFVKRVVAIGEVWGAKSNDRWVCVESTVDVMEDRSVMPFWSDRAYASQCAIDQWSDYEPEPIPLELFLEQWFPGMETDNYLVGTNWNVHLCGYEIEAPILKLEIEKELENVS